LKLLRFYINSEYVDFQQKNEFINFINQSLCDYLTSENLDLSCNYQNEMVYNAIFILID